MCVLIFLRENKFDGREFVSLGRCLVLRGVRRDGFGRNVLMGFMGIVFYLPIRRVRDF